MKWVNLAELFSDDRVKRYDMFRMVKTKKVIVNDSEGKPVEKIV